MRTIFKQLNVGWNADPNDPRPQIEVTQGMLVLTFCVNPYQFPQFQEDEIASLTFHNCSTYRLGPTNDEGWYRGQCRFTGIAPHWGEFYEISGDSLLEKCPKDWIETGVGNTSLNHFLFYFRDETFECFAESYNLSEQAANKAMQADASGGTGS